MPFVSSDDRAVDRENRSDAVGSYEVNAVLTMKKPHPCGGGTWRVVRVGADVKLVCLTCGRYVTLTRDELKKRLKAPTADSVKAAVKKSEKRGADGQAAKIVPRAK